MKQSRKIKAFVKKREQDRALLVHILAQKIAHEIMSDPVKFEEAAKLITSCLKK